MEDGDRTFNDHLFQDGDQGASAAADGKSALLFPTSAANTSVEMFEARTPVVVEGKELIPDTGGPGRHRGALGQRVVVRKLVDDGRPMLCSLLPQGIRFDTPGLAGGGSGRRATIFLEADGRRLSNEEVGGWRCSAGRRSGRSSSWQAVAATSLRSSGRWWRFRPTWRRSS